MLRLRGVLAGILMLSVIAGCSNRVKRANELIDVGSVDQAITLLNEEIARRPKNAEAHYTLGLAWRKKGDIGREIEAFQSALIASSGIKQRIEDSVLKQGNRNYRELDFLNTIDNSLVKQNEDFAYAYLVEMGSPSGASAFASNFPQSKRAAHSILIEASADYEDGSFSESRLLYQKVVDRYPASEEAKAAKSRLASWWTFKYLEIPINGTWEGCPIRGGQHYRYEFLNSFTISFGALGVQHVDGDHADMFIGTRDELHSDLRTFEAQTCIARIARATGQSDPEQTKKTQEMQRYYRTPGQRGSGVAPRDGYIWFRVDTRGSEYEGNLRVKVYLKDQSAD